MRGDDMELGPIAFEGPLAQASIVIQEAFFKAWRLQLRLALLTVQLCIAEFQVCMPKFSNSMVLEDHVWQEDVCFFFLLLMKSLWQLLGAGRNGLPLQAGAHWRARCASFWQRTADNTPHLHKKSNLQASPDVFQQITVKLCRSAFIAARPSCLEACFQLACLLIMLLIFCKVSSSSHSFWPLTQAQPRAFPALSFFPSALLPEPRSVRLKASSSSTLWNCSKPAGCGLPLSQVKPLSSTCWEIF